MTPATAWRVALAAAGVCCVACRSTSSGESPKPETAVEGLSPAPASSQHQAADATTSGTERSGQSEVDYADLNLSDDLLYVLKEGCSTYADWGVELPVGDCIRSFDLFCRKLGLEGIQECVEKDLWSAFLDNARYCKRSIDTSECVKHFQVTCNRTVPAPPPGPPDQRVVLRLDPPLVVTPGEPTRLYLEYPTEVQAPPRKSLQPGTYSTVEIEVLQRWPFEHRLTIHRGEKLIFDEDVVLVWRCFCDEECDGTAEVQAPGDAW